MSRPSPEPSRSVEVLHSIVEEYIDTGEPVASRTISRRRSGSLSAASIRNVMADLCEEGYLAQPHTSAGRVPTEKAFRSYIASLRTRRLPQLDAERLRAEFSSAGTVEERVERSSHLLTELTRNIGIAAAIPTLSQSLDQIELISLGDRRVLAVVVTCDRMVRNRVVVLDEQLKQDDLASIRNYINREFSGWPLDHIREELERRLATESAVYDEILRRLNLLYGKGLLDIGPAPELHMDGASYLVGLDLHLTREKMRELFRALEEKKRMLSLLDQFLEQGAGEVAVKIGLGEAHPSMRELSLIGLSVAMPAGLAAKIAVLGPMRMNYVRVMSVVFYVGEAIRQTPD
ncbi:MAG: heat-inducible transcriptional repressor HrcA [Acidobacteria bacterium]|nr:heat-inducible transcriptional repressor HrcA [Acidobacteriota bacterium]